MTSPYPFSEATVRPVETDDDKELEAFDNTKLVAINTCPTWGIIRYGLHKTLAGTGRAMALEAGSAAHEVYAAVRLWQLRGEGLRSHFEFHGTRIFGSNRWDNLCSKIKDGTDENTNLLNFALEALYSGEFYDDPNDRNRTVTNIEEGCIAYIDRYDWTRPVWVQDRENPECRVGVENAFELVIEFDGVPTMRFTGRMDGIHTQEVANRGNIIAKENKTGARLDDAWLESFILATQVTGYCVAASQFTGQPVTECCVIGQAIPIPKNVENGIRRNFVSRNEYDFERWFKWLWHTRELYLKYKDDPINAPQYTHSCNRYFRLCSLMPFCYEERDEKQEVLDRMIIDEWTPLEEGDPVRTA